MGQLQERYKNYREPQKFMEAGVYPYFREITGKQGTEVEMGGHKVLMFGSNAYTGLTGDQRVIDAAKKALDQYGSGCAGSRSLMVLLTYMSSWKRNWQSLRVRMILSVSLLVFRLMLVLLPWL